MHNIMKKTPSKNDTITQVFRDSLTISKDGGGKDIHVYIKENTAPNHFKDVLPILTLVLGIFLNRMIDFFTERKKIKRHGARWHAELSSLVNPIDKQIGILEAIFIQNEKESTVDIPRLTVVSSLDCSTIQSLDRFELIRFLEKIKNKKYSESIEISNQVKTLINILETNYETLKTKYADYLRELSKCTTIFVSELQNVQRNFAEYGVELEREIRSKSDDSLEQVLTSDPRFKPLLDLFDKELLPHMRNPNFDYYNFDQSFLTPLLYELANLRLDQRTQPLANSTRQSLIYLNQFKQEKYYFQRNLETIIEIYKSSKSDLEVILKRF